MLCSAQHFVTVMLNTGLSGHFKAVNIILQLRRNKQKKISDVSETLHLDMQKKFKRN